MSWERKLTHAGERLAGTRKAQAGEAGRVRARVGSHGRETNSRRGRGGSE